MKILVVDADADQRRMCATSLYYNGFDVSEADTGIGAIETAKADPPDLILMDVKLPDVNGLTIAHIIKAHPKLESVPILCLAGLDDVTLKDVTDHGCVGLLRKPIGVEDLIKAIRLHIPQSEADH